MAQPEPKSGPEIQEFKRLLENPASEAFVGVDSTTLEAFRRDYLELVALRPWFRTMWPQYGPLWLLILTSLMGMRWGVVFWLLALAWMFAVGYRRFGTHRDRWAGLMQRGRAAGIIE